ncbi:MAG: OmpH family outer membrane protein [Candidatus Omnitrophica bacterium]|nr:OmpH family outer membrane protein [Candidatus Omnitrophota bacterium]
MRLKVLFLVLFFLVGTVAFSYAEVKLAYVDLSRIFEEYNKTKDYDKVLTSQQDAYEKERQKKVDEIKQIEDKLNLLSDKEKENQKKQLEDKVKALREFDQAKQTDLRKQQDEKMREILKDIEQTIRQYAESQGYSLVFNDRVLVYQAKTLDITDKIIEALNKNYKKQ